MARECQCFQGFAEFASLKTNAFPKNKMFLGTFLGMFLGVFLGKIDLLNQKKRKVEEIEKEELQGTLYKESDSQMYGWVSRIRWHYGLICRCSF